MTRRTDTRTARLPVPAGELPPFTPVPRQYVRHDGWTPERQIAFIEALADTGSVAAACRAVDMSQRGAYHLRCQPGAESFREAWDAALDLGVRIIEDTAMEFERRKKQWRKEWEAEQRNVSAADVRASIDRKIETLRRHIEAERARQWAQMSDETRAAWARFVTLRERDLTALGAAADGGAAAEVEWDEPGDAYERPAPPRRLPAPRVREEEEEMPRPPAGWRREPAAERERKTVWTLKDEGW